MITMVNENTINYWTLQSDAVIYEFGNFIKLSNRQSISVIIS